MNSKCKHHITYRSLLFLIAFTVFLTTSIQPAFSQTVSADAVISATDAATALASTGATPEDYGQALINFVTYGSYSPADTSHPSMLSAISRVINAIALFVMAWLAVLGGTNFIIQTANKGVPGGQVISSFWMPLRISVATILLVPLASGYSTLQMGVTKVAETGNAHGSYLTRKGIEHLQQYGAYSPPLMGDSAPFVNAIVGAEMCRLHINTVMNKEVIVRQKYSLGETRSFSYDFKDDGTKSGARFIPGYCGGAQYFVPGLDKATAKPKPAKGSAGGALGVSGAAIHAATNTHTSNKTTDIERSVQEKTLIFLAEQLENKIIPTIASEAEKIVGATLMLDNEAFGQLIRKEISASAFEKKYIEAADEKNMIAASNKLIALQNTANAELQKAVAAAVNTARAEYAKSKGASGGWAEEVSRLGWTALGTIYWQQSSEQRTINSLARSITPTELNRVVADAFINDERMVMLTARMSETLSITKRNTAKRISGDDLGRISSIQEADDGNSFIREWTAALTQSTMLSLTTDDDQDFVGRMQYTGNNITAFIDWSIHATIIGQGLASATYRTADKALESTCKVGSAVPLIGGLINAAAGAACAPAWGLVEGIYNVFNSYISFAKQLLLPLLIAGFVLAVVLPAIPLFYWIMGVVSWILFYIECLLVSPIWLAAHGTAEKEGWGSEHTRQGYMLMIGLYLNPILRVAGFFAILTILYPLSVLIQWFSHYIQGVMNTGALTSPFIIVGSMMLVAFLAYGIAMRIFSLPNEIFERGLRWVNGGQEVTGDQNSAQRINAMMATFGGKAESMRHGMNRVIPISDTPKHLAQETAPTPKTKT